MMNLADISTYARLTEVDWEILQQEARGFYLEVGTFHGASACAALIGGATSVTTLDIYDWQPKIWDLEVAAELRPIPNDRLSALRCTSVDFVERWNAKIGNDPFIDVLFIDGSHEYDSVRKDCEALVPYVVPGGTVLFHDHNPNNPATGVWTAVNEYLKNVPHQPRLKIVGSSNLLIVDIPNVLAEG